MLLGVLLLTHCRQDMRAIKRSEKAFKWHSQGEYIQSAERFLELANDYPESNFYPQNLWNAAWSFQEGEDFNRARQVYRRILSEHLNDAQPDSSRGLWETHANYQHYACRNIAAISMKEENYADALLWLDSADFVYPYINKHPKQLKRAHMAMDHMRSDCYYALGQTEEAFLVLLPHALIKSPWHRHPSVERCMEIIVEHYDPDRIAADVLKAIEQRQVLPGLVRIRFRNHPMELIPFEGGVETLHLDDFKNSDFYRTLCIP